MTTKHDSEKLRWDLMPWYAAGAVQRVLNYGAKKYAPNNWKTVAESNRRYFSAAIRHLTAWWTGEDNDPESGEPHLAHAACCIMFLLENHIGPPEYGR